MFVITEATGQVGSHIAKYLLEKKQPVRIIVSNPDKAKQLAELGATVHVGDIDNPSDIQAGFAGGDVVFLLDPPVYHEPNVEEITRQRLDTLKAAIVQKGVKRVVALTSGGVHQRDIDIGNLRYAQIWEDGLKDLNVPVSSLRPAWFMENWLPAIDIAKIAAEVMLSTWKGFKVLELEGPQRYSANDVENTLSKHLGKDVHPSIITREALPSMLLSINTHPNSIDGWVTMLDFTNGDKAPFEHEEAAVKGTTTLDIFISLAIEDSN
ncbi:hypothetical protein Unana1_04145 [Umbelopsis nana]